MRLFSQHPDLDPDLAQEFRERHLELFESAHFISTNNEQVVKSFTLHDQEFVIKRYPEKGPRAKLRSLLGISRAMNSFKRSAQLSTLNIQSPPHLFIARHLGILRGTSHLIMKKSPGTQLTHTIDTHPNPPFPPTLMSTLADLIKRLHAAGFTHGDLHAANIFVLTDLSLELIDLDNMHPTPRRQAKDLARILRSFDHQPELQAQLSSILNPQS